MNYIITQENAQKILAYLVSCRYQEVFQLIAILQNIVPVEEKIQEVIKKEDSE